MTTSEVLRELEQYGNEQTKKVLLKHGVKEPFFGVKVADLKKIQKKIKKDYQLALELFDSGNSDAMYLAGLIADESQMTEADLNKWAKDAYWYMISEYTVAWVTSETPFALKLGMEWIDSDHENIASSGWSTLANLISIKPDEELEVSTFSKLLDRVATEIHDERNRVRYTMNGFVIATAAYLAELTDKAVATAETIGKVYVDVGGTACKVPLATEYIQKIKDKGRIGKKRKEARC
ncbi:DNA alkylation repair protein [Fulvivirgaceae bacterium BMA12]|uniref:DNA alkylation repair protein n=1 Tax=Agaribacillus aureus TaxID=3051825 RepID=A0ABT8L8E3_9BACT|nr:DNA alkylation repair protein [Fulvivirgaceae bacterium BMA12]